jgi:enoyl-CoA hydratase/carnithine racemase
MTTRAFELVLATLTLEQQGRVLVVRVVDPPYNYMTARMQKDLDLLTAAVDTDESIGAVILTGGVPHRYITRFDDVVVRIMRSPTVYLAAIGGPCGGGGMELSVCFDVRIAADDEHTGFMLPELLIGLTTTVGGQRLAQLIGPARALEMLLQGRRYSSQEVCAMGLVDQVVPSDDLLEETMTLATVYARRNRATVAAQKRIFNEHHALPPGDSLRRDGAMSAVSINAAPAVLA